MTHPVAQKMANGYGLYDMSGNVWEWVWDSDPDYPGWRFYRGGSYGNRAGICEVSCRYGRYADDQDVVLGFRLLRPKENS